MSSTKEFIAYCDEHNLDPKSGTGEDIRIFRAVKAAWNHQQMKIDSTQNKINAFGNALHSIQTLIT